MAKQEKIITKKEFEWFFINPIGYLFFLFIDIFIGLAFIILAFIPIINAWFPMKIIRNDEQYNREPNPLYNDVKYRIKKQTKITEEVLERV